MGISSCLKYATSRVGSKWKSCNPLALTSQFEWTTKSRDLMGIRLATRYASHEPSHKLGTVA